MGSLSGKEQQLTEMKYFSLLICLLLMGTIDAFLYKASEKLDPDGQGPEAQMNEEERLPPIRRHHKAPKHPSPSPNAPDRCVNLKLTTKSWASEISWKFGSCKSPELAFWKKTLLELAGRRFAENTNGYADNQEFTIECCQPAGTYELDCKDKYKDGWHGGYIEIGGVTFCKGFRSGSSKKQQVQH